MSKAEDSLLSVSVQLGSCLISLDAWPDLPVRGLAQRLLSRCGLDVSPDAVELHLGRYLLPPTSSLGNVISRWHRPVVVPTRVVRLKAQLYGCSPAKSREKLEPRGAPLHTVQQVAAQVAAALAIPAGPARLQGLLSAAAVVCLLPFTFTNWTEAWDHSLMKLTVLLFRALLPQKPDAASSVLQACSKLLDVPVALAPRGQLYQSLCAMQMHIDLLQVAMGLKAVGQVEVATTGQESEAGRPPAAAPSVGGPSGSPSSRAGGRGARRSTTAGAEQGCGGGGGGSSRAAAAAARQREAAYRELGLLLGKAAKRVGWVLEQLSCYGSELSDELDQYRPPSAAAKEAAGADSGAAAALTGSGGGPLAAASPLTARDVRLEAAEVLEPYAAMQLMEALARLMPGVDPAVTRPHGLPPGTVPSGNGCHRSLFHTILDLATSAGARLAPATGAEGHGAGIGDAAVPVGPTSVTHGSARSPTLELSMVAALLDSFVSKHVRVHEDCRSPGCAAGSGGSGVGAGNDGGRGDDSSGDSNSSGSDVRRRCCPRTLEIFQMPPCLDWLLDIVSVLGAACDVYALAGGSEAEEEGEGAAEAATEMKTAAVTLPLSGNSGAVSAAAAAMVEEVATAAETAAAAAVEAGAAEAVPAAAGATAAATVARIGAAVVIERSLGGSGDGGGAAMAAFPSEPTAPRTPPAAGSGAGGSGSAVADPECGVPSSTRPCPLHPATRALSEPASPSPGGAAAVEERGDGQDVPAPGTPPPQAAVAAAPKGGAGAAGGVAGPGAVVPTPAAAAAAPGELLSARAVVLDTLFRAFQCPCLVQQALAGGARSGQLCGRAVWRHPRLAGCAPAAAYQKQLLDELLTPLSYVYEEDDYDAPMVVVDRADLLGSSVASVMELDNLCHEGICVAFEGEAAYGDGVLREWLTEVAAAVFDPNAGLFRMCDADVRALHLSSAGCQQDNQLELLSFAGRIMGLALRARVPLGFHLSSALYKLLQHPGSAGRARLGLGDLAQLEPRLAATCRQIAAADDVEALGLTFVASCGQLGAAHEVPLLPGGRGEEHSVTAANRADYLARLVRFYCSWGCSSQHGAIAMAADGGGGGGAGEGGGGRGAAEGGGGGGWEACELDAVEALAQGLADALLECEYEERVDALAARLRPLTASAFNSRLGGEVGSIDVAAWRSHTSAPAFNSDRERAALEAFWSVVSELPGEEQRRLLQFWTGISHLPAGGFKHLSQQLQIVPARPDAYADGAGVDRQSGVGDGGGGAARSDLAVGAGAGEEGSFTSVASSSDAAGGEDPPGGRSSSGGDSRSGSAGSGSGSSGGAAAVGEELRGGATGPSADSPVSVGSGTSSGGGGGCSLGFPPAGGPSLLAAHTCFFQLRLPLLGDPVAMRVAVAESLANMGAFWNE